MLTASISICRRRLVVAHCAGGKGGQDFEGKASSGGTQTHSPPLHRAGRGRIALDLMVFWGVRPLYGLRVLGLYGFRVAAN